jgi:RNA polymerase sigma factor for flagellar operon FliA
MMIVGNTAKSPAARRAYEDRREALIKEFAPTIKYLASRLAVRLPSYLDAEDLFSVGLIGLLNAFDRYDPTREAKFKTYAEYRIRGAMLDEIRSMDWIPRSVRDRITLLQRTCDGLQKRLGRPPTEEEIAEAMGFNQEELSDFLVRSQGAFVLSLDDLASQEPEPRILLQCMADPTAKDPLAELVGDAKRKQLGSAIEGLPNKERMVLTLYYYEELTMKEIGKVLSVTESRVSQLHSQALIRLKGSLKIEV